MVHKEYVMGRNDTQFKLRLPEELKQWLKEKAQHGYHSMQAEALGIIAEAKRRDDAREKATA